MFMSCKRSYNKKGICSNKLDHEDSACHEINKQHLLGNSVADETVIEFQLHQVLIGRAGKWMRWERANGKP